jgi:signal peptidase II
VSSAPKKSSAGNTSAGGNHSGPIGSAARGVPPLPLNRYVIFAVIAICGCTADLLTKQAIFRWRGLPRQNNEWWLIDEHFGIETSVNPGALFGMGAGGWWLFASLSVVAFLGIAVWLFYFRAAHDRWLTVALGFVTGGIFGNLYDRLGLWDTTGLPRQLVHGVRDWILFKWEGIPFLNPWPNFNIADSLLVTGAIMLVIHALVWRDGHDKAVKTVASA